LLKHQHSVHATDNITKTAQVVLEVYRKDGRLFIHPLKVWQRHSPTLYMLHSWEREDFRPVTSSATIADILASVPQPWLDFTIHRPGVWIRTFQQAQQTLLALRDGQPRGEEAEALFHRLMKMVVTRDERLLSLAETVFGLADVVGIMKRMIGSGLIGGKSLGMLLARAILRKADPQWADRLESHDSFYIGADVFYTYIVENGCWWLRRRQKDFNVHLQRADQAREKMLRGTFPEYIQNQFMEMLEYFGQSPIIVRSSSLLEDSYGNAFSGKYESVFCANQGTPQERLEAFMAAVRTVYASTMSREGLLYRLHHGLLDRDEQMALLVQRVSGEMRGQLFFPQIAGVGFSFNPFVWDPDIDPRAGVLRLVFGLGTRAVEHTEDDYTRLVALNVPHKRAESRPEQERQYAQRRVDVLDLQANKLLSREFETVGRTLPAAQLALFANSEELEADAASHGGQTALPLTLTFERLFRDTRFVPAMRELLTTLEAAYNHPVDIEFTANFTADGAFRINLVQCRPFQVKIRGEGSRVKMPEPLEPADVLLQSSGPIIGHSLATLIDRLIYVRPAVYSQMSMSDRYSVARTIGRLAHADPPGQRKTLMLVGPGRWGTSMPSLGVPVSFAEINTVSVLCELTVMHEGLIPDVSLGTHFFNDLVEMDMLYFAVSPGKTGHTLNEAWLLSQPNRLAELLPSAGSLAEAIWVVDSAGLRPSGALYLNVDSMKQQGVCYRDKSP
jgi:hypothetical protein